MKTILVATEKPFAKVAIDQIKGLVDEAGFTFQILEKYSSVDELLDNVKNANALIVRSDKVTKEVVDAAGKLEIVVRAGAGYDNLDLDACSAKNVVAMNTPGQNSNAVAELALGMMVMAARNMYNGTAGTELLGKKLGIHAYGNVGKHVARIAKGFGMEVYAFDPFVSVDAIKADGIAPVGSVEELYKTCQYISLHIPANDKTNKSINKDLLGMMPKGATLINTARKEVIDEEGVIQLMADREDFKYMSDIAPEMKDDFQSKFGSRVFFSPKKLGAQTSEANVNAGVAGAKQIIDFFNNGNETFRLNK